MSKKLLAHSFGHALLVALYTSGIASVLFNSKNLFKQQDTVFAPILALMLFVLSAAIVGSLVLGRPILLYLDGKKSDALKMFGYTLAWLAVGTFAVFLLNLK